MLSAPRLCELSEEGIRALHHHVHVQGYLHQGSQRGHHYGTEGNGWDELAVHDVDVEVVCAGLLSSLGLIAQPRKVGGEHRRGDFNEVGHS